MPNPIPTRSRQIVLIREQDRCLRCGGKGTAWHHRRTREVADEHQHCPCNGVYLCTKCHTWVHLHPGLARVEGWIVSRHVDDPGTAPVVPWWSGGHRIRLRCNGDWSHGEADTI